VRDLVESVEKQNSQTFSGLGEPNGTQHLLEALANAAGGAYDP
jgi:hypothetical protein